MEALLETQEIIISPVLHNMMVHQRTSSEIQVAMANYFDATTEALEMCRQLLQNIKDAQRNYKSMDSFLASISASHALGFPFTSNNPFCTTTRSNLRPIHDKYSCILKSIRSSHRRVGTNLDTVSNLVARLSDAIERENAMARWCAERADERSSVLEMANELKRSCSSSKRLTDELEEHACLFLATIHRARNLVIQEISKKA
jgi:hypothetical protein